jgi:hypothetical protein
MIERIRAKTIKNIRVKKRIARGLVAVRLPMKEGRLPAPSSFRARTSGEARSRRRLRE